MEEAAADLLVALLEDLVFQAHLVVVAAAGPLHLVEVGELAEHQQDTLVKEMQVVLVVVQVVLEVMLVVVAAVPTALELLDLLVDTVALVFKFQQHLEIQNLYYNQVLAELLIGWQAAVALL